MCFHVVAVVVVVDTGVVFTVVVVVVVVCRICWVCWCLLSSSLLFYCYGSSFSFSIITIRLVRRLRL